MVKLILSDMDGTLLPFGQTAVSERTHRAILAAQKAGIRFGAASGRDRAALLPAFRNDEACVQTGIMANGKQVFLDGTPVLRRSLPPDAMERLAEALLPYEGSFVLANVAQDELGGSVRSFALGVGEKDERARTNIQGARQQIEVAGRVDPAFGIISAGIFVDVSRNTPDDLRRVAEKTCPELAFPQPAPFFLDVIEHGWTKASALPPLLDAMGIAADEVIYVGDSENDLTMMKAIPNSYAVANATPEAKAAARQQIGSCEDDAVARLIEDLLASQA